jgi:hypothetical protein
MSWLDRIPWVLLLVVAVWLAIVPFGQPHLVEKWRMLFAGTLRRGIDWFDLVMHTAPLVLVLLKLVREITKRAET